MNHDESNFTTLTGTAGGTLASLISNIHSDDLIKTILLASVGATISFFLSLFWKWLTDKLRK